MHRFRNADPLLRYPALRILPIEGTACGRGVDPHQGIQRRYGPIRSEREYRTVIEKQPPGITRLNSLRSELLLGPATVIDRMIRLHGGNDAERGEPHSIRRPQ